MNNNTLANELRELRVEWMIRSTQAQSDVIRNEWKKYAEVTAELIEFFEGRLNASN